MIIYRGCSKCSGAMETYQQHMDRGIDRTYAACVQCGKDVLYTSELVFNAAARLEQHGKTELAKHYLELALG